METVEPATTKIVHEPDDNRDDRMTSRRPSFSEVVASLDWLLCDHLLVESYWRFVQRGMPYPFVDMRELKPGAAGAGLPESEVSEHNYGLIIVVDGQLGAHTKKYLRFKDKNRVVRENLATLLARDTELDEFELPWTLCSSHEFSLLIRKLIRIDYGLLIQYDPRATRHRRFALTHFRVRIDWPVVDAAEELARELRYIDHHLYEHNELRAEQLEAKLYERYGFHHTVGGRRTAGIVASQYLRGLLARGEIADFRVYVCSTEARNLTVMSPERVDRYTLVRLDRHEIDAYGCDLRKNHLIHVDGDLGGIALLAVGYELTEHSRFSEQLKAIENLPSLPFLRIDQQRVLPRSAATGAEPVACSLVYQRSTD